MSSAACWADTIVVTVITCSALAVAAPTNSASVINTMNLALI
jgi:hypothetical protein